MLLLFAWLFGKKEDLEQNSNEIFFIFKVKNQWLVLIKIYSWVTISEHRFKKINKILNMSCELEDAVTFEPLGGVTSIFFDDKTHQVRNKIFSKLKFW